MTESPGAFTPFSAEMLWKFPFIVRIQKSPKQIHLSNTLYNSNLLFIVTIHFFWLLS